MVLLLGQEHQIMRTTTTILSAALSAALLLPISPAAAATPPASTDVTASFIDAGINLPGLRAVEVGGILVLRGIATDPNDALRAGEVARTLGYTRVANLV